jgi:hypothetical protein
MKILNIFVFTNLFIFINGFNNAFLKMNIPSSNSHNIPNFNVKCLDIHSYAIERFISNLALSEKTVEYFNNRIGWGSLYKNERIDVLKKVADIELIKYNVYNINIVTNTYTKLPHFQMSLHSFGKKIITTCDLIPKVDYFLEPEYLSTYYKDFVDIKKNMTSTLIPTKIKNLYTEATLTPAALSFTLEKNEDFIEYLDIVLKYIDLYCCYIKYENNKHIGYLRMNERDNKLKEILFENAPGSNVIKKIFRDNIDTFKKFSLF